jgi:hypothetical protein
MSSQEGFPGGSLDAYALDRANMLNGNPATFQRFNVAGPALILLPGDLTGAAPAAGSPNIYARAVDGAIWGGSNRIDLFAFHVDWAVPASSTFTALPSLNTGPFSSNLCGNGNNLMSDCAAQPGTTQLLETLPHWSMGPLQFRTFGAYDTLVFNHTVDAVVNGTHHAAPRWYELRRPSGGAWSINQQGNYDPDASHRWMGSVAMDKAGDMALGYSISSNSATNPIFPSVRYTGRLASDPLSQMPAGEFTLVNGSQSQIANGDRWGDYSAMRVDPVDGCTFWYTQEYIGTLGVVGGGGAWNTRIGAFWFPSCNPGTSLAFTSDSAKTSDFSDPAMVAATLRDAKGNPLPGKKVTFTLTPGGPSGTPSCFSFTDATGTARCAITPNQKAGSYTLTASFAGDPPYLASSTTMGFTVTLEETTLNYTGPVLFANGVAATLSGNLREDGTTPIFKQPDGVGTPRTVSFTLGSGSGAQSCSGTTDATGTAKCTITVNQPLGPTTVSATFASDGFYQSASDSKPALVFSFVGGGLGNGTAFVIGDKNAVVGKSVTFWGAQWDKVNSLSGGAAPAAFKGFANKTSTTPPSCGATWTTRPGDSSKPPSSVPSFMAVIAASSITKSGATISGNIRAIVIVKTDPGYAPDPGHPGTGTVVAVLCS